MCFRSFHKGEINYRTSTRRVSVPANSAVSSKLTMAPSKRPNDVIDLTDSNPVGPKTKQARTAASSSQAYASSSSARPSQSSQASSRRYGYGPTPSTGPSAASQQRDAFDDEPDLVDLTQADDGPVFGLYGTIDNKIVGVRYYNGIVSPSEVISLRREPTNQ